VENDDDFAARMRAKRGALPRHRVPWWRQLLDLTLANVHEMIMSPGVACDDGTIDDLGGIVDVLSRGDTVNAHTGEFAVHTKLAASGGYEDALVERRIRRVLFTGDPGSVGWLLVPSGRVLTYFESKRYVEIVKTLPRSSTSDVLVSWIRAFEDENPILSQHLLLNERVIGERAGWRVSKIEAPADLRGIARVQAMLRALSIEFVEAKDQDDRATLWLSKREGSWIDHEGKLVTPWGAINVASGTPARPSFDQDLVRRILGAQTVLAEVPLAA
jgi:hypothetical protein